MSNKKYLISLFVLLFVTGCNNSSTTTIVTPTSSPKIEETNYSLPQIPLPVISPVATPKIEPSIVPTPKPTYLPTIAPSVDPSGYTGTTSDIKDKATLNGKVYDSNGIPVDNVIVTAKSIDSTLTWVGDPQITQSGAYVFRNAPVGARLEITAQKSGWTTRSRTEVLKSNLIGDPQSNVFEFGNGPDGTDTNNLYYIQDEPEITSLSINNMIANYNSGQDRPLPHEADNFTAGITGVKASQVFINLNFSEPVMTDSVENNFRIKSQKISEKSGFTYTITKNTYPVSFNWSNDNTHVTITIKDVLIANKLLDSEYKYLLDFSAPFKDKFNNNNVTGRAFRLSKLKYDDFYVFSVKL